MKIEAKTLPSGKEIEAMFLLTVRQHGLDIREDRVVQERDDSDRLILLRFDVQPFFFVTPRARPVIGKVGLSVISKFAFRHG